jgi:hypothetical protein
MSVTSSELLRLAEHHAADVRAWGWSLGWPISPA